MFEALDYQTNATWADVLLLSGEDNFPILTEDFYGRGRLLILNVPENFADLYNLPADVIGTVNRELTAGQPIWLMSEPKWSLICYDNEVCCLHSFRPMLSRARVAVRDECKGLMDLVTGVVWENAIRLPAPHHRGDAARTRDVPPEYAFEIPVPPGKSIYLKVIR